VAGQYGRQIDNVRLALDWAFSPPGDASIGVRLTVAAIPLWFQLPLIDDCFSRVQQALTSVGPGPSHDAHVRHAMQLRAVAVARPLGGNGDNSGTDLGRSVPFSFERASLGADRAKDSQCSIIATSNPTSVNTAPK
jgi:hypothetical protein